MPREPALGTLRELARCFQAFEAYSSAHIRTLGLTPPQFDIVATLGNTCGMSFKELGEKTLITKGTLTGVLDRLEGKGLLVRVVSKEDRRSFTVKLTRQGQTCFESVFPGQLAFLNQYLSQLSAEDRAAIEGSMARFRAVLSGAPTPRK